MVRRIKILNVSWSAMAAETTQIERLLSQDRPNIWSSKMIIMPLRMTERIDLPET